MKFLRFICPICNYVDTYVDKEKWKNWKCPFCSRPKIGFGTSPVKNAYIKLSPAEECKEEVKKND